MVGKDADGFTFPTLPAPQPLKPPLTAKATVKDATKGIDADSIPRPVVFNKSAPTASGAGRAKRVPFEKGFSQMDWIRLKNGMQNPGLRKDITLEEVKAHKADGWCAIRGKVYNISSYMRYHPGGADILKGSLGKDATALFQKYHPWVNVDALIDKCLLGWLAVPAPEANDAPSS